MLKDDFFTIQSVTPQSDQRYQAEINLNVDHPIYQGHFPEMPVVPGVCQIGMVKEVLEEILQKELILSRAKNIKFTNPIEPGQINSLLLELGLAVKEQGIQVKAELSSQGTIFLKFSGLFTELLH